MEMESHGMKKRVVKCCSPHHRNISIIGCYPVRTLEHLRRDGYSETWIYKVLMRALWGNGALYYRWLLSPMHQCDTLDLGIFRVSRPGLGMRFFHEAGHKNVKNTKPLG